MRKMTNIIVSCIYRSPDANVGAFVNPKKIF